MGDLLVTVGASTGVGAGAGASVRVVFVRPTGAHSTGR